MGYGFSRSAAIVGLLAGSACLDAKPADDVDGGFKQDSLDAAVAIARPDGPATTGGAAAEGSGGTVAPQPAPDAGSSTGPDAAMADASQPPTALSDAGPVDTASRGLVELQVMTKPSPHRAYGSRNVVAIWVENEAGQPVRLLGRWALASARALTHYVAAFDPTPLSPDLGDVDAVSAATRLNYEAPLQVTWDTRDTAGDALPDGQYRVVIELADSWVEPAVSELTFYKGNRTVQLDVPESTAMGVVSLRYTPVATP